MKHIYKFIILCVCLISSLSFIPPKKALAFQDYNICYSQAASYHFFWRADMCWDLIQEHCNVGAFSSATKVIAYLKNIYDVASKGKTLNADVLTVLKALLICKPIIEDCIVPKLQAMQNQCTADNYYYAPNLTAMSSWFNRDAPGLFYDDVRHTLTVQVLNNGSAYAWDIGLNVSYGTTKDRKIPVSGGGFLLENQVIPELVFFGAQQTGSQTMTSSLKDFLIDQSNFSSYLSKYKSDHTLRPFFWEKTIPFTAKPNELTKITMIIDPNQDISEQSEKDNLFSLIIDNLPTPHRFKIENLIVERIADSLTQYKVKFDIKNNGEEAGEAIVKWFDKNGAGSMTNAGQSVSGKGTIHVEKVFTVDVKNSGSNCLKHKDYRVEVHDEDGLHDSAEFEIPAFAGEIYGRVEDLFGKAVVGATVKTDTGAITTTQKGGDYHLKGIDRLGKVLVTVTSDKFSQVETKEVELTFQTEDFLHTCSIKGLTILSINFVMKNKPVKWTLILKDSTGHFLNGSVLASNDLFRHQVVVEGEKIIPDVQPGEYNVTASSVGYYPKFQKITLNPPDTTTEIILEKMGGRENDDGLRLINPTLLWKKRLGPGGGIIGELAATKNGKLIVVYNANNKTKTASLFFIDPLTGRQIKEVSVPYTISEQRYVGLDASYDGRTIGLFINPGPPGMTDKERILNLYDASGASTGSTTMDHNSIFLDVSPDGFYLYPNALLNSSLHKYTRKEIEGVGDGRDLQGYGSFVYFLRSDNLVSNCKYYQDNERGWCERTISDTMVRKITDIQGGPQLMDETFDDKTIIIRTDKKLYYFGSSSWEKEVKRYNRFVSTSISPGGMYTMVAEGSGSNKTLKIFGNTGGDKTPVFSYKNVRFVSANDKGLFFASVVSDSISYYQIGAYQKDYNAPSSPITNTKGSNFVTNFFNSLQSFFKKMGSFFGKKKP